MTDEQLRKLRRRAHIHTDNCYGEYETCGEHHMHSNTCGNRPLVCGYKEDTDLVALLAEYDRLKIENAKLSVR